MSKDFVLFTGNGNDGEFSRCIIEMGENDNPYAFAEMVIPNMFIVGHRARSHAYANVMVDGESEFAIYATLHEGHQGQTEMGAAYKTIRLEPIKNDWYDDLDRYTVKEYLDCGTMRKYRSKL